MLQPRLPWLCDWELCCFPVMTLSSEGVPAVWRKYFSSCALTVITQPKLQPPWHSLVLGCPRMLYSPLLGASRSPSQWYSRCVPALSGIALTAPHVGSPLLKPSPSIEARPLLSVRCPRIPPPSWTSLKRCCQALSLALKSRFGSRECLPTRNWSMQPSWLRSSMAGKRLPDRWPPQMWRLVRSHLAVGALGVPLRLMSYQVQCQALLLPPCLYQMPCLCQTLESQESGMPPARSYWSQRRTPLGSSTSSLRFAFIHRLSWASAGIAYASEGGGKKPNCWCDLVCTSTHCLMPCVSCPHFRLQRSLYVLCWHCKLPCCSAGPSASSGVLHRLCACSCCSDAHMIQPLPLHLDAHAHAHKPLDIDPSSAYFGSRGSPPLQFWVDSSTVEWSHRPLLHSCMGKAKRQHRQNSRPGQQNRELSRHYEAGESSLGTSLTAELEAPETSSHAPHALTPREKALFGYVTWSTSRPPPMTIFVRPYLQALTRSSSQRAGAHTVDADDEDADRVISVPSPSTPPHDFHKGERQGRGRSRRLSSRSPSLERGSADVRSLHAHGSSTAVDPRGRSPLPRRRGGAAGIQSAAPSRDVGISKDGEPFLLPKPKRYPLRKPASSDVKAAPPVTVEAAEVKPQDTTKPTKQTKQTKQSASSTTQAGGSTATSRLRKFRTPKSALKFTAAKRKPHGPSPPRGADPRPQSDNEVSMVDPPASVDPAKPRRPLRKAQPAARDPRVGKRLRTIDPPASSPASSVSVTDAQPFVAEPGDLIESLLKAPMAVDPDPLPPTPSDGAGGTETLKATAVLSSTSTSVRKSAALPKDYLYSEDGPLATAKRPRCKGIWFIPEPKESQDDPETSKGAVSSASLRAYKALMWQSFMCELWCFPPACHVTMPFHAGHLQNATMQGLRLCYSLQLRVKRHRTSTVRKHARVSRLRGRKLVFSWCQRRAPWIIFAHSCHRCLHGLLWLYHYITNHVAGPGPKSGRVVKIVDSVDVWSVILCIARYHWISLVDFSEPRVGCSTHPEFISSFALTMSCLVRIAFEEVEKLGRTLLGAAIRGRLHVSSFASHYLTAFSVILDVFLSWRHESSCIAIFRDSGTLLQNPSASCWFGPSTRSSRPSVAMPATAQSSPGSRLRLGVLKRFFFPLGLMQLVQPSVAHTAPQKRAYARACRRAAAHPLQGTTYRGRWCSLRELMGRWTSSSSARSNPLLRSDGVATGHGRTTSCHRLKLVTLNVGGLSQMAYAELLQHLQSLPQQAKPDVLLLQETHWREHSEYSTAGWHIIGSANVSPQAGGVAIFVADHLCTAEHILHTSPIPGRILHARLALNGATVDIVNVYQKNRCLLPSVHGERTSTGYNQSWNTTGGLDCTSQAYTWTSQPSRCGGRR